ncbi:MAG: hypothetical protein R2684_10780 [Pyrinomonadaceae bacterium]
MSEKSTDFKDNLPVQDAEAGGFSDSSTYPRIEFLFDEENVDERKRTIERFRARVSDLDSIIRRGSQEEASEAVRIQKALSVVITLLESGVRHT